MSGSHEYILSANLKQSHGHLKTWFTEGLRDALLNQHIFAGSGNIIKNEVLFRISVHPLSQLGSLPSGKLTELIKETRSYSFDFLKWKKDFVLKKHWLAHTKKTCPRCGGPIVKQYLGLTNRRTFFCPHCQKYYK